MRSQRQASHPANVKYSKEALVFTLLVDTLPASPPPLPNGRSSGEDEALGRLEVGRVLTTCQNTFRTDWSKQNKDNSRSVMDCTALGAGLLSHALLTSPI